MSLFVALLIFVAVATFTPGGATALATSAGMHYGIRKSAPLLAGLVIGLSTMAGMAGFGLSQLLLQYPLFRTALALAGTAYFVWLALAIARSGPPDVKHGNHQPPHGFIAGILLLWLNPKAWTMTLSAAASFGALAAEPAALSLLLGIVFGLFSTVSLTAWCLGGSYLATLVKTPLQWRVLNISLAVMLLVSIIPVWMQHM